MFLARKNLDQALGMESANGAADENVGYKIAIDIRESCDLIEQVRRRGFLPRK